MTGKRVDLDRHHILHGPRRKAAEEWGCWVWLNHDVHMDLHSRNTELDRRLKDICQRRFEAVYGREKWMEVFGRNYLED